MPLYNIDPDGRIVGHVEETGPGPYAPVRHVKYDEPVETSESHKGEASLETENIVEFVFRIRTDANQSQLDELMDVGLELEGDPANPDPDYHVVYLPEGSHWRCPLIDPSAAELAGGNRLPTERDRIVAQAQELDPDFDRRFPGPGRYEAMAPEDQALAAAIDTIYNHGFADDQAGSVEHGLHGARVGRFIAWADGQGFCTLDEYETPEAAQAALEEEDRKQNPEEEGN